MSKKLGNEYATFDRIMRRLVAVPHSAIKVKLDAEKRAKARKRKAKKPSASRASGEGA